MDGEAVVNHTRAIEADHMLGNLLNIVIDRLLFFYRSIVLFIHIFIVLKSDLHE